MYWTRVKIVTVVLLLAGLGGIGTAFWAAAPRPADSPTEPEPPADKLARDMAQSRLNLRKLVLAMYDHASANKGFGPPPALINKEGRAVLSWRVMLLPFLGEKGLYDEFQLSEPWDGPNNKKLLSKMPKVFAPPGIETEPPFSTFYQAFVSPKPKDGRKATEKGGTEIQAAFVQGEAQLFPAHFVDGTANTIFLVEAARAVPWTKPEDLPYAADKPIPALGGLFPVIFHAAFANGDIRTLAKKYDEHSLRTVITSNGGEVMDFDKIESHSAAAEYQRKNGELRQDLESARDLLRRLQEEREALQQRSGSAKEKQEAAKARLDELKRENAALQRELEKTRDEITTSNAAIVQRLQFPQGPPKVKAPKLPTKKP